MSLPVRTIAVEPITKPKRATKQKSNMKPRTTEINTNTETVDPKPVIACTDHAFGDSCPAGETVQREQLLKIIECQPGWMFCIRCLMVRKSEMFGDWCGTHGICLKCIDELLECNDMITTLPLSINTTRVFVASILAEIHTQEMDAKQGVWNTKRDERIRNLSKLFRQRCNIFNDAGEPIGYTDETDPFAEMAYQILREAAKEVWAYKPLCQAQ